MFKNLNSKARIASLAVLGLIATAFIVVSSAAAAPSATANQFGQCNGPNRIHANSPDEWLTAISEEGVVSDAMKLAEKFGFDPRDSTFRMWLNERTMIVRLPHAVKVLDYWCPNGSHQMLKWKYKMLPAGWPMLIVLPKGVSKQSVRLSPSRTFSKPLNYTVPTLAQPSCGNGSIGFFMQVFYGRTGKTTTPTPPPVTPPVTPPPPPTTPPPPSKTFTVQAAKCVLDVNKKATHKYDARWVDLFVYVNGKFAFPTAIGMDCRLYTIAAPPYKVAYKFKSGAKVILRENLGDPDLNGLKPYTKYVNSYGYLPMQVADHNLKFWFVNIEEGCKTNCTPPPCEQTGTCKPPKCEDTNSCEKPCEVTGACKGDASPPTPTPPGVAGGGDTGTNPGNDTTSPSGTNDDGSSSDPSGQGACPSGWHDDGTGTGCEPD